MDVKSLYLIMVFFIFSFLTSDVFAQGSEYQEIPGQYVNEELDFSFVLPENFKGFAYEYDNPSVGKIMNIQIHPGMNPQEKCCPGVPSPPANFLFENHPDIFYSTPIPFTGDLFAAFQAYNMNVKIDAIGEYQVLSSTLDFDKEDLGYTDTGKVIGKSYFFDTRNRYISYSILASEEHYNKHIEGFEESAKSITIENSTSIDLDEVFLISDFYASKLTPDSSMLPKMQTPSMIDSVHLDESSSTVKISITEPNSFRSFFAINIGELFEGPYAVTFDGDPIDVQILETNLQKYIVMFYFGEGQHEIIISGTSFAKDTQTNPTSQTLNSPLQQFHSGVPYDEIQCHEDLELVQKYNGLPACVKQDTKKKLMDRGWMQEADVASTHILKYSPVLFKGTGVELTGEKLSPEELQILEKRKVELDVYLDNKTIPEKTNDERRMIQQYAQWAFDEEVPWDLVQILWEKKRIVTDKVDDLDRDMFPIVSLSGISIGFNAYSVEEQYSGKPTAIKIGILKEQFTKETLERTDQMLRELVGDEIDIIYYKSSYIAPYNR